MTQSRYYNAFLLSTLTFLILYILFLSLSNVKKIVKPAPSKVIKISIITPPKKVAKVKTPEPIVEKIEPIVPVVIPTPEPKKIVKKKIVKKKIIKKKKVIKKKVKKKIVKKRVIKKPIKRPVPIVAPVYHAPKPRPVVKPKVKPAPQVVAKTKNDYHKKAFLRNVRAKIIANKKYPKIAKRRHIEGSVKVRFDIDKRGHVCNIRFINGKRIFQKSIKKTLARTFPMGIPQNVKSDLPILDVSVVLHFNIR